MERGPETNRLDFGVDSDQDPDSGSMDPEIGSLNPDPEIFHCSAQLISLSVEHISNCIYFVIF